MVGTKLVSRQFEMLDLLKIVPDLDSEISAKERLFKEIREMKHASYVLNPKMIAELWRTSSMPSKAFQYVSGLILTHRTDGYAFLPIEDVDKHLVFERVSAGKSKFKLVQRKKAPAVKHKDPVQMEFDF